MPHTSAVVVAAAVIATATATTPAHGGSFCASPVQVPRRFQAVLPKNLGILVASGRLELRVALVMVELVIAEQAWKDGHRLAGDGLGVYMPASVAVVPQFLIDLVADFAGQTAKQWRGELEVCGLSVVVVVVVLLLQQLLVLRHLQRAGPTQAG